MGLDKLKEIGSQRKGGEVSHSVIDRYVNKSGHRHAAAIICEIWPEAFRRIEEHWRDKYFADFPGVVSTKHAGALSWDLFLKEFAKDFLGDPTPFTRRELEWVLVSWCQRSMPATSNMFRDLERALMCFTVDSGK